MHAALDRGETALDRWRAGLSARGRIGVLAAVTVVMLAAAFVVPAIPQPQEYHLFADARTCFGIPNFANVLSNAAFAVVGLWGLVALAQRRPGMFAD